MIKKGTNKEHLDIFKNADIRLRLEIDTVEDVMKAYPKIEKVMKEIENL